MNELASIRSTSDTQTRWLLSKPMHGHGSFLARWRSEWRSLLCAAFLEDRIVRKAR
jgi:hypothetical protein